MVTSHNGPHDNLQHIVIATHFLLYGAAHALRDYLLENKKTENLLFITLPLASQRIAQVSVYKNAKKIFEKTKKRSSKENSFNYILDIWQTVWWVVSQRQQINTFFGFGVLNAFTGILLKRLGIVQKTIFYSIDFVPKRFSSILLNNIYHWMEKVCLISADEVWDVSPRMASGREKFLGISTGSYQHKVIPIGVWNKNIKKIPFFKVKKHQLLFIGHLLEKQGVQMVLEAIPQVVKKIPDFQFLIIGGGEFESKLKYLVEELHLERYVTFTGWIKERKKIDSLLGESACAIAPYKPEKEQVYNFTYYADPTKIKDYLASGLPIIMTDVSYNAHEIAKKECGFVVEYDSNKIASAIISFLSDTKKIAKYRENCFNFAKTFDWSTIFTKAFNE